MILPAKKPNPFYFQNQNRHLKTPSSTGMGAINPIRWKGHYLDVESGYYYIDRRYYDPEICGYVSADTPGNLLLNAGTLGGINRYGLSVNNAIALLGKLPLLAKIAVKGAVLRAR